MDIDVLSVRLVLEEPSKVSREDFLRSKDELNDALASLEFKRLSLFQPCMIITPHNRYGVSQALTLAVWPTLSRLMVGPMSKFRGIAVTEIGAAMAKNAMTEKLGVETLHWKQSSALSLPSIWVIS